MTIAVFLFGARAWTQLTAAILLVLAARLLSPTEVGIFSIASALTMVLTQWVGVGTYEYIIHERHDLASVTTAFWVNILVAALMAAVGLVLALFSAHWFHSAALPLVIASLAPLTVPSGFRSAMEALMIRDGHSHRVAVCTIVVETAALIVSIVALYEGFGLWSLVVQKWIQLVGGAIVFMAAAKWLPRFYFNVSTARKMLSFGAGIFGNRFLMYFQTYGVDLVIGALLNPAAVAIFRVGARLVTAFTTTITEPLRQISWKRLSDTVHHGGVEAAAIEAERLMAGLFTIFTGPLIGIAVTSDLLVRVILGAKWMASAPVVEFLALAALVGVPGYLTEAILGSVGQTRWLPPQRIAILAIMFILLAAAIHYGPAGAALSQLGAAVAACIITVLLQRRLADVKVTGYWKDMAACIVFSILMIGPITAARFLCERRSVNPAIELALCVIAGGLTYALCLAVLYRERLLSKFASRNRASAAARRPV